MLWNNDTFKNILIKKKFYVQNIFKMNYLHLVLYLNKT
jgi:hypothetical protein